MKLKYIRIEKYKLFRDFDIDFCSDGIPQDIIVIAGINGTGKSTLLDYIRPQYMSTTHYGIIQVLVDNKERMFQVPPSLMESIDYKEVMDNVLCMDSGNSRVASKTLESIILKYVDKVVYEEGKTSFEAYGRIQAMIDDIFSEFNLHFRFKGLNADKHLKFVNSEGAEFGVEGLSDGERQLLEKVFPLFASNIKGQVVLMDEPDISLHPSWQSFLLPVLRRCAQNNDCQFIIATHSPQIISSAHNEELRILTRNERGDICAMSCEEGPYGWTVERVLDEIQNVKTQRVPEIDKRLERLRHDINANNFETDEFKRELTELEELLGVSDRDLTLIKLEMIRRRRESRVDEKDR